MRQRYQRFWYSTITARMSCGSLYNSPNMPSVRSPAAFMFHSSNQRSHECYAPDAPPRDTNHTTSMYLSSHSTYQRCRLCHATHTTHDAPVADTERTCTTDSPIQPQTHRANRPPSPTQQIALILGHGLPPENSQVKKIISTTKNGIPMM